MNHLTEFAVIVTNGLVVVASLALALVTAADVEKDQQKTIRQALKALIKKQDSGGAQVNPEAVNE